MKWDQMLNKSAFVFWKIKKAYEMDVCSTLLLWIVVQRKALSEEFWNKERITQHKQWLSFSGDMFVVAKIIRKSFVSDGTMQTMGRFQERERKHHQTEQI